MAFLPLFNVICQYDFLNSLIKIDDYISFAIKNKLNYLFYSENTTMHGINEFIEKATKNNIKPIVGITINLFQNEKIIIYAKNDNGYKNLCYISSELNNLEINNEIKIEIILKYIDNNNIAISNIIDKSLIDKFKLKINDKNYIDTISNNLYFKNINYINVDDSIAYKILTAVKNNKIILNFDSIKNIDNTNFYPNIDFLSDISNIDNMIKYTNYVNENCKFDLLNEYNKIDIPKFKLETNVESKNILEEKCLNNLKKYYLKFNKSIDIEKYKKRLNKEIKIINSMGFSDYFLIVQDYVKFAKTNDILVGPGRGSAAGSLVSFLLGITSVDPIKYNLIFERFLNAKRKDLPDIDIDFQDDRRHEILEYLYDKYGKYNFATITTFQTIGFKMALRDGGKALNINSKIIDKLSRSIKNNETDFYKIIENSKILSLFYKDSEYKLLFNYIKTIISFPRQISTHAAGVIISNNDLREKIALKTQSNGINQVQCSMNSLDKLGLIKMDILGLRNLSTIQEIKKSILKNYNIKISLFNINLNDQKVYKMISKGNTMGIFQLESFGMTDLIKKMDISSIEDISTASALYRPGPKEMIPYFLKNKKNYIPDKNNKLNEILNSTYGIIIYQEQIIQILQIVANFSLEQADIIRKYISKKNIEKLNEVKVTFLNDAVKNNYTIQKATEIWDLISKFGKYGFNKSHSISYSIISYWLMYFKYYFPTEFYSSLLNSSIGNIEKTIKCFNEIKNRNIIINKPNISYSKNVYTCNKEEIFTPFNMIKTVGNDTAKKMSLIDIDINNCDIYKYLIELIKNNIELETIKNLIKAGIFDVFKYNKKTLLSNIEKIYNWAFIYKDIKKINDDEKISINITEEYNYSKLVELELDSYGFLFANNLILKIKNIIIKKMGLSSFNSNYIQNILVYITEIKEIIDKNNRKMAFIKVWDENNLNFELVCFADTYDKLKNQLLVNKIFILKIKNNKTGDTKILNNIVKKIK